MGSFDQGWALGAQKAQRQAQFAEANRIAGRNSQAAIIENALNNPDTSPTDRAALLQQHSALFQPHEAPDLFKRLSGLIHGQQPAAAATQPTSSAAPTGPAETNGPQLPDGSASPPAPVVNDALGIPISDPAVAAAHQQPMHPMATNHPILDRFREGLDALGNHLKGFVQPTAPNPQTAQANNDVLARSYASPISVQRQTAELAAQHAQELAQTKGELNIEGRRVTAGGSSAQARYIRAVAQEKGKEPGDLTPEEMQQAIEEYGQANRRPQTIVDPTNGVVNIVTRDADGAAVAAPMRDRDGQLFGGFKPNTVTIRNGVYHFIGADNQVHEVPVTTTSTKIFGPHFVGEDKPLQVPKPDPEAQATPISTAPTSATPPPPSGKGLQRRGAAVKAPPTVAPTAPQYPGKTLGPSKLNAADRGVLESDQQLTDSVNTVLPTLEKIKDRNSLADRAKMEIAWQQYKHGMEPSDPQLGEIIRNVALLQIQGAAPWTRIGRSKYTFDVIQKHLPAPTDTPKLLYDKVKWLKDNVIPSSVNATISPAGVGPTSKNAPKSPSTGQSLADRLNEALGAAK